MRAYLDASVLLPALVTEGASPVVEAFLASTTDPLIVSDLASAEVASALSRLVRTGLLKVEDGLARLTDFDAWRASTTASVDMESSDVRLADIYVRRFDLKLRAPDALHAAICRRLGMQLITLDKKLFHAATTLGIPVRMP